MATELEDAKIEKVQDSIVTYPDGSQQVNETHKVYQDDVLLGSYRYVVAVPAEPAP